MPLTKCQESDAVGICGHARLNTCFTSDFSKLSLISDLESYVWSSVL